MKEGKKDEEGLEKDVNIQREAGTRGRSQGKEGKNGWKEGCKREDGKVEKGKE